MLYDHDDLAFFLNDRDIRDLLFPEFAGDASDERFEAFISSQTTKSLSKLLNDRLAGKRPVSHWYDAPVYGLSDSGKKLLKTLREQARVNNRSVEHKHLNYLEQLSRMYLKVPDTLKKGANPRSMYRHLTSFCEAHDIPEEIVSSIVPTLVEYTQTGHMRPVIFHGQKGCGKTTAVKMLVEEALNIPTVVIKIPQTDGSHGLTGDTATYVGADVGRIAKARLDTNSLLVAYIFDEIDKVTHERNRASVDDELLSITDESNSAIIDNYLETSIQGLEYCPMFFTANDMDKVSPILADRCTVISFPDPTPARIKSISRKFVAEKRKLQLYESVRFNYELMDDCIDRLVSRNITSLRRHQQVIEMVFQDALNVSMMQETDAPVNVTKGMFDRAEESIAGTAKRTVGF